MFRSINPKNNKLLRQFDGLSSHDLERKLRNASEASQKNLILSQKAYQERVQKFGALADIMTKNRDKYAELIVDEMGKPITQARGEVDKSILHLKYYMEHGSDFLKDESVSMMSGHRGLIKV